MDDIIKKTIKELVLNFISEMNEWEKFCNNLKNENTQLSWNEKHDMMKQKATFIFTKYCTHLFITSILHALHNSSNSINELSKS